MAFQSQCHFLGHRHGNRHAAVGPVSKGACGARAGPPGSGQPVCSNHVGVSVVPMELCREPGVNLMYQRGACLEPFADLATTKLGTY